MVIAIEVSALFPFSKAEMEERRRKEEEERKRLEEEERIKREREAEAERKRREQEEKDRELQVNNWLIISLKYNYCILCSKKWRLKLKLQGT